jgi:hypothetical protein
VSNVAEFEAASPSKWDQLIGVLADIPWGVLSLITLFILIKTDTVSSGDIAGLGAAAGLLGVGHGLHMAGKHRRQ